MSVFFRCDCGRAASYPDEWMGTWIKCTDCRVDSLIPIRAGWERPPELEPAIVTERPPLVFDYPVDITLGVVETAMTKMTFVFHIDPHGPCYLQITTSGDYGRAKPVTIMRFDDTSYDRLVDTMAKAAEMVERFRNSGPGRRMTEHH